MSNLIYRIKNKIKLFTQKGNKFICPYCGFRSKDFNLIGLDLPVLKEKNVIGAGRRKGGCFRCQSTDRERLIYIYLTENLKIQENPEIKILHIAPEKRLSNKLISMNLSNYFCGDLFTEGYEYPEYVKNMNVQKLNFEENWFDLVICNHVLEHILDDKKAMKEIFRVLKPGGKAILMVPIAPNSKTYEDEKIVSPEERERHFGQFDHVRIYGEDYFERLKNVGFETERISLDESFFKFGINPKEEIFLAKKP